MPSKGGRQSRISLKESGAVTFDSKNANIFCRFFSNLADSLLQKLPHPKNKFRINTTRECCKQIWNKCEDFVLHNVEVRSVEKILKNLDVAKSDELDQIPDKFLKDSAQVIPLANTIKLPIKLDTSLLQCKTAKTKLLFKKGIKTEAKNYIPISLLPLISKVIEKSTHNQLQDYLQRNELLYSYQSCFRAKHSTDTYLSRLTDMILNDAENGKHTSMRQYKITQIRQ